MIETRRATPNYFVGIRLHGLEPRVDELHDRLIRAHPELQYYVTSSKRLHFTCFTLSLSSEEDVERAVQCLQECKPIVNEIFETDRFKSVSFSQLDDFPENVLYLKASESESMSRLERMTSCLKIKFNEIGLLGALREDERWTPHMTIAKKSKNLKRTLQDKRIFDASEYEGLARSFFADAALVSKLSFVELLSMRGEGTPESDPLGVAGYYKTVCAVNIHCS